MSNPLDELYRDIIMDHYRYPRGQKKLDRADMSGEGNNPLCGDEIEVRLKLDGDTVQDLSVGCRGCAISVASGSMLYEIVRGKSLDEVRQVAAVVKALIKGEALPPNINIDMGDLEALQGVRKFPVRVKCALLAWTTLTESIESFERQEVRHITTTE